MLKNFISLFITILLTAVVHAADLPELMAALDSEDYTVRNTARADMQSMLAKASAPGADPVARMEQETLLLSHLQEVTEPTSRLWCIRMLEWFGTKASVPTLQILLPDSDPEHRDAARRALTANPSEAAAVVLRTALKEAPEAEKAMWVDALLYRKDYPSTKAIAALLKSDDPVLAKQAANALGKLGGKKASKALRAAYKKAPEERLPIIEAAMLDAGVKSSLAEDLVLNGSLSSIRAGAFKQLAVQDQKAATRLFDAVLEDVTLPGRSDMLYTAMSVAGTKLPAHVISKLPDMSPLDQQIILAAISDHALSAYETEVLALLPTATDSLQDSAARALSVIGGPASFTPLYNLFLEKPSEAVTRALATLPSTEIDAQLFAIFTEEQDEEKHLAAIKLLGVRNPPGTVEQLHSITSPDQPEALRKAAFSALETVGNTESAKRLASIISTQDSLKRDAQKSLKKLALNLGAPDILWDAAFKPALAAAKSDAARKDLLAILDAASGPKSLAYLDGIITNPDSLLRPAAIKTLSRWTEMRAGEIWLKTIAPEDTSEADIKTAQKALVRILARPEIKGGYGEKLDLAVKAISMGPTPAFKVAILECYKDTPHRAKHLINQRFPALLDDPDVGLQVYALLDKEIPPAPSVEPGFTALFDGATRKGWTQRGGKAKYAVRNGVIVGTSVLNTPNSFLCTDVLYDNFELRFEVKCGAINSGVQIRSRQNDKGKIEGPQVEIEPSPGQSGYVYGESMGTGWLSPEPNSKDEDLKKHSRLKNKDWNDYRIIAQGPRIQTFINGELVADLTHEETFASHPKGFIGLQVHSHNVAEVEIEWRNIRIQELDYTPPAPVPAPEEWTLLLDEPLSAWEVWTGVPHTSVQNLPEGMVGSKDGKEGTPMGLGDPKKLYTVSADADGAPVLYISGEVFGGITTLESFSNYHLTLQFKWGEKKWEPRLDKKRDSGLLYHAYGEHGAFWNVWKRSLELQIQEGDFGDLHCIGDTASVVSINDDKEWDPASGVTAKRGRRSIDKEAPHGEWTRIDLYVIDDSAVHVVDGTVVLALKDAKTHDGNPLSAGQIQIQSESAECFIKDLRVKPINAYPLEILQAAGF